MSIRGRHFNGMDAILIDDMIKASVMYGIAWTLLPFSFRGERSHKKLRTRLQVSALMLKSS
jgi:hypothetical protein